MHGTPRAAATNEHIGAWPKGVSTMSVPSCAASAMSSPISVVKSVPVA